MKQIYLKPFRSFSVSRIIFTEGAVSSGNARWREKELAMENVYFRQQEELKMIKLRKSLLSHQEHLAKLQQQNQMRAQLSFSFVN